VRKTEMEDNDHVFSQVIAPFLIFLGVVLLEVAIFGYIKS
jgi:hypothetical protein